MKLEYWKRELERCGFQSEFKQWLLRTIAEGVDVGYKGDPRNHKPYYRSRSSQEVELLSAQYEEEGKLGRVIKAGKTPPSGKWFPKFFVSPTYVIPKKRVIGQPQKWRLIHDLSSHTWGHPWSVNAGIRKSDFPVTYPSIATAAHTVFCVAKRGCVLWGRDLKAYYRHLMINPAHWWCTGTHFEGEYYFDAYCPFGARSMPAVFQRLSDAIRIIMLKRTPVEGLLGMLDDFLGVTYRKEGETDEALFARGRIEEKAFDVELTKMGISKQTKKDSPTAWKTIWLGFELDTKERTLAIPQEKENATIMRIQEEFFDEDGGLMPFVDTVKLGKLVGTFCHMSQGWALGKTLLWPLYKLLSAYREYSPEGKPYYRKAQVELGPDAAASMMEWYERINVCGIYKKFYTCHGNHHTTQTELWTGKDAHHPNKEKYLRLVTPWGSNRTALEVNNVMGFNPGQQRVTKGILLLLNFLEKYAIDCGDVIVVKTNVAAFARYIRKDCYPAGLRRQQYYDSRKIHHLLATPERDTDGENRMMHPRQLKAWLVS